MTALLLLAACFKTAPVDVRVDPIARPGAFPYALYDEAFADRVTDDGFIDYAAIRDDRVALNTFLAHVAEVSPATDPELFPSKAEGLAFYLNAYNGIAVRGVLDRPDMASVIDQKVEFFYKLENGIVRADYGDPRIHFFLNCQSISCPAFPPTAIRPESLDATLDEATTAFVTNPAHVEVMADGTIAVSSIFQWYADDFGGEAGVLPFIHTYNPDIPESGTITYKDYDWGLIKQPGKGPNE